MIVGLSGYARSGKDTVGRILVEELGFERRSFADHLREAALKLDPFVHPGLRLSEVVDTFGWETSKDKYPEVRRLLQRFGTELGRNHFGENFWVDIATQNLPNVNGFQPQHVVFTDVRFPNEAWKLREYFGGKLWRVTRPGTEAVTVHISETALDDYDFDAEIDNSGTVDDLRPLVFRTLAGYLR